MLQADDNRLIMINERFAITFLVPITRINVSLDTTPKRQPFKLWSYGSTVMQVV